MIFRNYDSYCTHGNCIFSSQIRSFFRSCNKRAACNCAVAARIGDDVIVLDRCGASNKKAKKQPLVPKLYLNGELTTGTAITRFNNGRKYKVRAIFNMELNFNWFLKST